MGFSDKRLAWLSLQSAHLPAGTRRAVARGSGLIHETARAMTGGVTEAEIRAVRHRLGVRPVFKRIDTCARSEEHTSELQSIMRTSYAIFCLNKKMKKQHKMHHTLYTKE